MPRSHLTRLLFQPLSRLVVVCVALFSMLAMQWAVAAYVCPMAKTTTAAAMAAAMADMPDCNGQDPAQPGLCHLHAQGEPARQTADTPQLPSVQPFFPAGLLVALQFAEGDTARLSASPNATSLTRTTAPPLAIRHCCFLI